MAKIRNYVGSFANGLGFWIGVVICVPIILFLISKLFFGAHNDVTVEDIKKYMSDSEQIKVKIPPYKSQLYIEDFGRKPIIESLDKEKEAKAKIKVIEDKIQ